MPAQSATHRSRQKSCVACAEGKRRCNRQTPQCSRCLTRGVQCTYVGLSTHQRKSQPLPAPGNPTNVETSSESSSSPFGPVLSDALSFSPPQLTVNPTRLIFPPSLSETLFPDIAFLDKWSTSRLLQSIKSFPRMFAQHRTTPFIHPRLYGGRLPGTIQDAFAASASYCMKSPETEDMVFQILETKGAQIALQDPQSLPVEDLLAAVQALMLLYTMQLFDGDVRQRSIAEQGLDILRAWTLELQMRATNPWIPPSWEAWIFAESARRTIILSIMIEQIYSTLKTGFCTLVPTLSILPFTPGAALWNASTYSSWVRESGHKGSDVIFYGDYSQGWKEGRFQDKLDAFQKLLLTPCMGEAYRDSLEVED